MLNHHVLRRLQRAQKPTKMNQTVFQSRVCEQRTAAVRVRRKTAQHSMAPAAMVCKRAGFRILQA